MQTAVSQTPFDSVNFSMLLLAVCLMIGLPTLGWVLMAIDIRRYLRALRARSLMVIELFVPRSTPYWVLRDRPPCLAALGISMPCTEEDVLAAYREKVKTLHPDRGGEMKSFLRLQKHFEQALHLVRQQTADS